MTIQELQEFHQIINDKFNGKGIFESIDIENVLEKQIPKKPKVNYPALFCPCCKSYLIARIDGYFIVGTECQIIVGIAGRL